MIKIYKDCLHKDLIKNIFTYLKFYSNKDVWGSSFYWNDASNPNSSNIITHEIGNKSLINFIKKNIEDIININFDEEKLLFIPMIYIWSSGSYLSWHNDDPYPYNGTIYLNTEWDSNNGGIFLYKDNKNKTIIGVEPKYNDMIVNTSSEKDPHNLHCVTCIPSFVNKKRITLQWRTVHNENVKNYYTYE